ncbi:MAG: carboxypeptidase regulatory-like domain-containing protein [Hymenobacter sp.]
MLDSLSRQPVAYATVVLLPAAGDKPITGVAADDQGKFSLTKLAAGTFRLRASYVGYGTRTRTVTVGVGPTEVGTVSAARGCPGAGRGRHRGPETNCGSQA